MNRQKAIEAVHQAWEDCYSGSAESRERGRREADEIIEALSGRSAAAEMYKAVCDSYGKSLPPYLRDFMRAKVEEAGGAPPAKIGGDHVARLEEACRAVVEQLSPANVDVVIRPGEEPYSVRLCREALLNEFLK